MGVVDKIFKSGDSAAVLLPDDIAFAIDTPVMIERSGDVVTIRAMIERDPIEEKRKLTEMIAALRALGPVGEIEQREPIDFPERPGM